MLLTQEKKQQPRTVKNIKKQKSLFAYFYKNVYIANG